MEIESNVLINQVTSLCEVLRGDLSIAMDSFPKIFQLKEILDEMQLDFVSSKLKTGQENIQFIGEALRENSSIFNNMSMDIMENSTKLDDMALSGFENELTNMKSSLDEIESRLN